MLDAAVTWLGFRLGLGEANPFVRVLMHGGPLAGALASKAMALGLGGACGGGGIR